MAVIASYCCITTTLSTIATTVYSIIATTTTVVAIAAAAAGISNPIYPACCLTPYLLTLTRKEKISLRLLYNIVFFKRETLNINSFFKKVKLLLFFNKQRLGKTFVQLKF